MLEMPHLSMMRWDPWDQLQATAQQAVSQGGTPEITYYVYDSSGHRIRKVTERYAGPGKTPTRKAERIYLDGFELYREYEGDGSTVKLERETLRVGDGEKTIAFVETRTQGDDRSPVELARYQLDDLLGSACLELDAEARVISYEEYYPFGSTSYQAVRSRTEAPKRYRYTGKERDEESGLYYHGARYYACWLGRWVSADPAGMVDGPNLYAYARDNPLVNTDPTGMACDAATQSCTDPTAPTEREEQEQRSIPEEHPDFENEDEEDEPQAFEGGESIPVEPFDADQWLQDVNAALKEADSPEYKAARAKAAAEKQQEQEWADERRKEAELDKELPSLGVSLIPVYGSGESSKVHFKHGNYVRGTFYFAMAVSDVFLVKSLVVGAGKVVIRTLVLKEAAEIAAGSAPKLGARFVPSAKPIAVGLSRSMTHRPGLVGRFANRVGAITYWDLFPGALPKTNAEILKRMTQQFGRRPSVVNLSGLEQIQRLGVNEGLKALYKETAKTVTEAEIATILKSRVYFGRARFFLNGTEVTSTIRRARVIAP
jgi:RHS repeat-associated protein